MQNMKVDIILKTYEYQGNVMASISWKNLSTSFLHCHSLLSNITCSNLHGWSVVFRQNLKKCFD